MSDIASAGTKSVALLAAVVIGGGFYIYGKDMERRSTVNAPVTISVSADAKVSTPPDIAMVTFGMTTGRQPTAKAATEKIATTMTKVLAAVKALGVAEKDITTSSFYLSPEYDYTQAGQIPRGFQASESVTVKVRDLDKVGDILTAATEAGANQAGGISFSVDQPDAMKAKARTEAIAKAKAKAQVLAGNLGMSLGRMTGFSEDGNYGMPRPYMMEAKGIGGAMDVAAPSVPIQAGEQEIVSNVPLTYELK